MDWAGALSVNFGGNVLNGWRLPSTFDHGCVLGPCTNSELGHLYYTELGNTRATGSFDAGDFQNLQGSTSYWSETEAVDNRYAWSLNFNSGNQGRTLKTKPRAALAVMTGMAVAPEPLSSTLFIIGGATLGLRRFRMKFKK